MEEPSWGRLLIGRNVKGCSSPGEEQPRVRTDGGDYSALIASTGHSSAHAPQSVQVSAFIVYLGSPSLMASTGQAGRHVPHMVQSSEITCGI